MMSFSFLWRSLIKFVHDCFWVFRSGELLLVTMSGRYGVKSGCAPRRADVFGRSCIVDGIAGDVLLKFLAAASTFSVTLSRGDCLSWRKAFSAVKSCMWILRVVGDCIVTSFLVCALGCLSAWLSRVPGYRSWSNHFSSYRFRLSNWYKFTCFDWCGCSSYGRYRCKNTRRHWQKIKTIFAIKCSICVFKCCCYVSSWLKFSWSSSFRYIRGWRRFEKGFQSIVMYNLLFWGIFFPNSDCDGIQTFFNDVRSTSKGVQF